MVADENRTFYLQESLDRICHMTSIVFKFADWKEGDFSNTIGGPSRGVLLVGKSFYEAFDKSVIVTSTRFHFGTKKMPPVVTRNRYHTTSCDN